MKNKPVFAFFGTSKFSVIVLETLKSEGLLPTLIITVPDNPKGRNLELSPTDVKVWAQNESIPFIHPASLRPVEVEMEIKKYSPQGFDTFIVASYGKIIPNNILEIPRRKTLNVHPSLLPKLRGASPIQSAILQESETGVTIIRLDEIEDHGPIIAQEKVETLEWPPYAADLEKVLAIRGGKLLIETIPLWIEGVLKESPQDEALVTKCGKIEKKDGELDLHENTELNLRKIRAFHESPHAYFFDDFRGIRKRIIVKKASITEGKLVLERIVPEGKREMDYTDYLKGKLS